MSIIIVTSLIIIILLTLYLLSIYHTLTTLVSTIEHHKQQMDAQLDKRFNTFEALMRAVQQFMDYERSTLKDVMILRARAEAALAIGDEKGRLSAESEISKIASHLPTIFEQYPELKAGKNVLQLQEEIANNETKLAYAKQAYNESLSRFLIKKTKLIESLVIKFMSEKLDKTYTMWK